jgi:hypothetical protein
MVTPDEWRQRIANVLSDAPWEHSKSCQQKAAQEQRSLAAKARRNARAAAGKVEVPTEYQEQRDLCRWLLAAGVPHFAVPNEAAGGKFDPVRWSMQQAIGGKKGIIDLVLVDLAADGKPVVIEMKRTKGANLSDAQRYWAELFPAKGWHHVLAFGADDAIRQLKALGYGSKIA